MIVIDKVCPAIATTIRGTWTESIEDSAMKRVPSGRDRANTLRKGSNDAIDTLAKAVDTVRASDTFKAYLDTQARFHNYSWHNTWMIYSQRPNAERVAGFKTWLTLGRHVRKGEKGIAIFAPMRFKKENDKGETEDRIAFRVVHVFDVSQTDGKELPTVEAPNVETAADNLLADLVRVADSRGIAVTFQALSGGRYGTSAKGAIEVDNTHATGQQAKTLAHELAHEAMHWEDRGSLTRSIAELEAESVAYVVSKHFGLDTSIRSSSYIALWNGDGKAMRESMDRIAKAARTIIDDCIAVQNRKAVA